MEPTSRVTEYWIGKGINYDSVWASYEAGQAYIEKYRSMRVHLLRIELAQFPVDLPLFNHEAVYKTIKGYFHDFKEYCLSRAEYAEAGPLFLYSVDRGSGIWNFLGEPRLLVPFALTLAEGKVLGQEIENLDKKLDFIRKNFPGALHSQDLDKFMRAKTPRALQEAVSKLMEQGIRRVQVSREPFEGEIETAQHSLIDIGHVDQLILQGGQVVGDKIGRDKIEADHGSLIATGHAKVVQPTFNQMWDETGRASDLEKLAQELSALRTKMHESDRNPEQDVAIGHIAAAEIAANRGNGPSVLRSLKKAGPWALEFASKVGASLVAEYLKHLAGM